ncbi:MAG: response regulator transcription factor [Cyanobacteria bacterium REEB67]|nr:response regulator transcription factor [Cyanobacteria bacterium REEB67]
MLTQHDNDSDILASLAAGASGYCLKDVEPERLYTAVRSVREGDAWLDASIASRVLRHYANLTAESGAGHADNGGTEAGESLPRDGGRGFAADDVAHAQVSGDSHEERSSALAVEDDCAPEEMDRPAPEPLSPRELEVLRLIVAGLSNQEIADKLFISLATAKTHVRNILNKLAVDDRTQAAVHAMRRRLV